MPTELLTTFRKCFKEESATNIAQQFVNIKFDWNENINIFANSSENIERKRFPQMQEAALE